MNEVYRDIEKHIPALRRYAGALTRNSADAEDLVQESVLKALEKSHLYQSGTNLRAWLFTIIRNQHISDIRRTRRAGVPIDPEGAPLALSTQPNQEDGITIHAIERALRGLPNHQRALIQRVALEGWPYEEVAKSSGLALGTVKSRIARGRSRVRIALERQNYHEDGLASQSWRKGGNETRGEALH